jgi:hypothetical protein
MDTRRVESDPVPARFQPTMALTFDSTSPRYIQDPGTVAILRDRSRTIVLLCDGGGSWGAGIEAAAWSLQYLQRRWSGSQLPELPVVLEDVASLHSVVPRELAEADFGCGFSFVLLHCSGGAVRYCALGLFSVVLFDGKDLHRHFQPDTLGAELIKRGMMSEAEASRFRNVGCGPWITDEAMDPQLSEELVLASGSYLLVLPHRMAERLDATTLWRALASETPAAALQATLGVEISLVIVAG